MNFKGLILIFLHLGKDCIVKQEDIIGIFDLDTTTVSKISRDFLKFSEKRKQTVNVSFELPKSFVITCENGEMKVYISQLSPATLEKRAGSKFGLQENI